MFKYNFYKLVETVQRPDIVVESVKGPPCMIAFKKFDSHYIAPMSSIRMPDELRYCGVVLQGKRRFVITFYNTATPKRGKKLWPS